MSHVRFRDFGDLVISTDVASAAQAYARGIHLLITAGVAGEALLRDAVAADPNFALARVALDLAVHIRAPDAQHYERSDRADVVSAATRRERQHIELIRLALSGERERAAVLGREHLREFPSDALVAHVLASHGLT